MRLALDHHYPPAIAAGLRQRGHNVVTAAQRSWETATDAELLVHCAGEKRALLTNNVRDFVVIAESWSVEGQSHSGMIFTSDSSMPRISSMIGRYIDALDSLMKHNRSDDALADLILWL